MLKRYQNELIVLMLVAIVMMSISYKNSSMAELHSESISTEKLIAQMDDIVTMKRLWKKNKTIPSKLESIKSSLSDENIDKFKVDKRKAHILLQKLNSTKLNNIVGKKIASVPMQITMIDITREGDIYRLELKCKW